MSSYQLATPHQVVSKQKQQSIHAEYDAKTKRVRHDASVLRILAPCTSFQATIALLEKNIAKYIYGKWRA
jgi:hypothetical protein